MSEASLILLIFVSLISATIWGMRIIPEETDHFVIKENFVFTSDLMNSDQDYEDGYDDFGKISNMPGRVMKKDLSEMSFYSQTGQPTTEEVEVTTKIENKMTTAHVSKSDETEIFSYVEKGDDKTLFGWISQPISPNECKENVGYALTALRCMRVTNGSQRAYLAIKIIIFWLVIAMGILFIFWCTKGWYCCCCPFEFCKVDKRLREAHNYLALNPPGEWTDEKGNYHDYDATAEEKLIYEDMSRSFLII